jgi:hypothetical protein
MMHWWICLGVVSLSWSTVGMSCPEAENNFDDNREDLCVGGAFDLPFDTGLPPIF